MASKAINEHAIRFVKGLVSLSKSEIRKRCKSEVERLKSLYKLSTVRGYLTAYRKVSKDVEPDATRYLRLLAKDQATIQRRTHKSVVRQQKSLKKISNYEQMINKAVDLLSSERVSDLVCALCLLTGRRMTEILKTAKFNKCGRSKYVLYFKGQLKKREDFPKYKVYTLGESATECKVALSRLRSLADTKKLSNKQTERRYESTVNVRATQLFGEFLGGCSAHDLRKAYSTICTLLYKPETQTNNSFLSSILGHNENDINTANSYQKFYIPNL